MCSSPLYTFFKEVFGQELLVPDFDLNKVPFGYYEIVRAVPKAPNEVICGDNNYFVKDPQENYYYFRYFIVIVWRKEIMNWEQEECLQEIK